MCFVILDAGQGEKERTLTGNSSSRYAGIGRTFVMISACKGVSEGGTGHSA